MSQPVLQASVITREWKLVLTDLMDKYSVKLKLKRQARQLLDANKTASQRAVECFEANLIATENAA